MKWKFLCKCGDGSGFFENSKTGEIMNWWISGENLTAQAIKYFGIKGQVT